jgi:hypothetical protein
MFKDFKPHPEAEHVEKNVTNQTMKVSKNFTAKPCEAALRDAKRLCWKTFPSFSFLRIFAQLFSAWSHGVTGDSH